MLQYLFICLFFLNCSAVKLPSASLRAVKSWNIEGPVNGDDSVQVMLALKQRNMDKIKEKVLDVSDINSENYGKYWTVKEIADLVAPKEENLSLVKNWVNSIGAYSVNVTLSRDFLTFNILASKLENALNIKLLRFKHRASDRLLIRTLDPVELPSHIANEVEVVVGLTDFFEYNLERNKRREMKSQIQQPPQNTSAPMFLGKISGSESDIFFNLKIFCLNGQPANSLINPCNTTEGALIYSVEAVPNIHSNTKNNVIYEYYSINSSNCYYNSDEGLVCSAHLNTPPFARLNISAYTIYTNGNLSEKSYYPTLFAPTVWGTPQLIYDFYNIPQGTRSSSKNNSQSVVAFEAQYISLDDLKNFFHEMGLPQDKPIIHGINDPSNPGGESTLDIQYVMGIGAGVPTTFWSVSGPGPVKGGGAYVLTWAMEIADTENAPWVTSISYGDTEQGFFEKFGNYSYIERMNDELAKMALRGMTVVAGSGDAGASNVGEEGNDISDTDPTCTPMRPFFPSNSPYVVSASSTFLTKNALPICQDKFHNEPILCSQIGEVAVDVGEGIFWTTGGGFSNLTQTTPWQKDAVKSFLEQSAGILPPPQYWNASGRAYPDISTIGHNLIMIWGGQITPVSGTSASGPILAGIFSLLNDIRLSNNMTTIGLVTPFLYHIQGQSNNYFRDVVVGTNFNGDVQPRGSPYPTYCPYGFTTQPGWDAVTGLGTPNYATLSVAFSKFFNKKI